MNELSPVPPPAQMMQMITGFWTSCCIYNAAKLDIADILASKPRTIDQLSELTHCHNPSLNRMMRALLSVGIFNKNSKGEYSNSALSETLRSGVPGSMKAMAIAQLGDHYSAWGNLLYSLKTGKTAFDKVEGMPIWKYYETHPEEGENFIEAMAGVTGAVIHNVIPAYDFTAMSTIVDIGGGNGALLMAVLQSAPEAKGIVFDEEYVVEKTKEVLAQKGYSERCSTMGGSFFDFIPKDADGYLMKMVLHDWNDEQSLQILNNCRQAMKPGSKLLVIESVIPEEDTPHPGKFMDINMLAMTGGLERTEKEFSTLFQKAQLKLLRVIPTHMPMFSILEVVKE